MSTQEPTTNPSPAVATQAPVTYTVAGMSCEHCERAVRASVEALAGVDSAVADAAAGTVVVTGIADAASVAAAVADAGYAVA